jgi:hypothetical protein
VDVRRQQRSRRCAGSARPQWTIGLDRRWTPTARRRSQARRVPARGARALRVTRPLTATTVGDRRAVAAMQVGACGRQHPRCFLPRAKGAAQSARTGRSLPGESSTAAYAGGVTRKPVGQRLPSSSCPSPLPPRRGRARSRTRHSWLSPKSGPRRCHRYVSGTSAGSHSNAPHRRRPMSPRGVAGLRWESAV